MEKILEVMKNIPNDKLLHSFYGVLIYLIVSCVNPYAAIGIVIIVAIGKEVYDEYKYKGFDWKDIVATVLLPIGLFISDII